MLLLDEVDIALAGGVSESIHTFGIFASFASQGALASHPDPAKASRPFDRDRNGIVCSEGGCVYVLERLDHAEARGAQIYGEIIGYHINSDATDFVLPNAERHIECMRTALKKAGLGPQDIDVVSTHATATPLGDIQECIALRTVFADCPNTMDVEVEPSPEVPRRIQVAPQDNVAIVVNPAGLSAGTVFDDGLIHHTINVDHLDPDCALDNLVLHEPRRVRHVTYVLNNSSGMLGINSVVVVKRV